MSLVNLFKRYDRLFVLIFGALTTFFTIYAKFNTMYTDLQSNKEDVHIMKERGERLEIFMEKQTLIDSRQNEILIDLKEQMKNVWHTSRSNR